MKYLGWHIDELEDGGEKYVSPWWCVPLALALSMAVWGVFLWPLSSMMP